MFPIRDHNPSEKTPYVTYILITVNILIFISYWHRLSDPASIFALWRDWAMVPAFVTEGLNVHGVVTSMFLHGGFWHIAGNMLFLWIFGDNLEEDLGHFGSVF